MNREDFDNLVAETYDVQLPTCDVCKGFIGDGELFWSEGHASNSDADEINNYTCLCDKCYGDMDESFRCPNCNEILDGDDNCSICDAEDE